MLALCLLLLGGESAAQPVVVLDPGHGGTNTGASSPSSGLFEKRLTLELARRIARYLPQWLPAVQVVLTRTEDTYVMLTERVRKGNGVRATLFVSLHFNASPTRSQQGFETFLLTREAYDQDVRRLSREARQGHVNPASEAVLRSIVSDLQRTATQGSSLRLAELVQRHLAKLRGKARDRGIHQAAFDVLLGLQVPAVLVEVGFLDHPLEGPELVQPALLESLAASIAAAIVDYLQPSAP